MYRSLVRAQERLRLTDKPFFSASTGKFETNRMNGSSVQVLELTDVSFFSTSIGKVETNG